MKTKYQRMTKNEKKEVLRQYKSTEKGNYLISKLRNVLIIGIISYLYSIYLFFTANSIWEWISAGTLFVAGCIFVIASIRLKIKFLTQFAVKGYIKK